VERQNLSVVDYGRRLVRKTVFFSRDGEYPALYTELLQAWFNFVELHRSLRVKNRDGSLTSRTSAMMQGLVDGRPGLEGIL
jgi:hypothetical protein